MGRTAPLTSKRCILHIYSTNTGTEYFKHALYSPFFPLQNAVCFIILTCLVPVLLTFYIQDVLKLKKKNNSGAKRLITSNYLLSPTLFATLLQLNLPFPCAIFSTLHSTFFSLSSVLQAPEELYHPCNYATFRNNFKPEPKVPLKFSYNKQRTNPLSHIDL